LGAVVALSISGLRLENFKSKQDGAHV